MFLGEVSDVLLGFLGSDGGLAELGSLPSEGLQTDHDGVEVLALPQVDGLEGLLGGNAAGLGAVHKLVDVLHALEGHLRLLDLLDLAGFQGVDQLAKQLAVLEHLVEIVHVSRLADVSSCDQGNPVQAFYSLLFAVLGIDLRLGLGGNS